MPVLAAPTFDRYRSPDLMTVHYPEIGADDVVVRDACTDAARVILLLLQCDRMRYADVVYADAACACHFIKLGLLHHHRLWRVYLFCISSWVI